MEIRIRRRLLPAWENGTVCRFMAVAPPRMAPPPPPPVPAPFPLPRSVICVEDYRRRGKGGGGREGIIVDGGEIAAKLRDTDADGDKRGAYRAPYDTFNDSPDGSFDDEESVISFLDERNPRMNPDRAACTRFANASSSIRSKRVPIRFNLANACFLLLVARMQRGVFPQANVNKRYPHDYSYFVARDVDI